MFFRMMLLTMLMIPVSIAVAAPQEREWPGLKNKHCGAELSVVSADESVAVHYPPREFFSGFESVSINQGEMPRDAIALATLLDGEGVNAIRITDCEQGTRILTRQHAHDHRIVMSGKGVLKLIRLVEGAAPVTLFRFIHMIDFSGPMITR